MVSVSASDEDVTTKIFKMYGISKPAVPIADEDAGSVQELSSTDEEAPLVKTTPRTPAGAVTPAPGTTVPGNPLVAPAWKEYVDFAFQRHMRLHENGRLEPGKMFTSVGDAFQKCEFENGDVVITEFPALKVALAEPPAVRKRPASAMRQSGSLWKRINVDHGEQNEEDEDEEKDGEDEQEKDEAPSASTSPCLPEVVHGFRFNGGGPNNEAEGDSDEEEGDEEAGDEEVEEENEVNCPKVLKIGLAKINITYATKQAYAHLIYPDRSKHFLCGISDKTKNFKVEVGKLMKKLIDSEEPEWYGNAAEWKAKALELRKERLGF